MSANNQVDALNKLITTLYDGENGYKEAAEEVDSVSLATKFREISQQRYNFGHEIKPHITKLGGDVDKGGSVAAGAHRVWMDIKSVFSTNDEAAILNECIRGEESAVDTYKEVLNETSFSTDVRQVVTRQLETVERNLAEMRSLAATYEKA